MTSLLRSAVCLAILLGTSAALAAPTEAEIEAARNALVEGRKKFDAGDYSAALERFLLAHKIMRVPTTGRDLMKAYNALDLLVEARAVAAEVINLPAVPNEKQAFLEARVDAKAAIEALDTRIPLLHVRVSGPPRKLVRVRIDGKPLPPEQIDQPYRVNPGAHRVEVSAEGFGRADVTTPLLTDVGKTYEVELSLTPPPRPASVPDQPRPAGYDPRMLGAGIATSTLLAGTFVVTGIAAVLTYQRAEDAYNRTGCGASCEIQYGRSSAQMQGFAWTSAITFAGAIIGTVSTWSYASKGKTTAKSGRDQVSFTVVPSIRGVTVQGVW